MKSNIHISKIQSHIFFMCTEAKTKEIRNLNIHHKLKMVYIGNLLITIVVFIRNVDFYFI